MDLKRILSGIVVGLSVLLLLLIPNSYIVGIILAGVALIAMNEYLNAVSKICKPIKLVAYLSCVIVGVINFIPENQLIKLYMMYIPTILLILFSKVIFSNMQTTFKDMTYTLLGICYIPIFMTFISRMNIFENGKILILYILIAAWISDMFAYYIGKNIGKHKFSKVSPKKSIEGCIGGILSTIIFTLLFTYILNTKFGFEYSYIKFVIISIILNIIGQIGDFSASTIKRFVDIKDYGTLLPGHGGILDRIDSVLFIAPFAYFLFTI